MNLRLLLLAFVIAACAPTPVLRNDNLLQDDSLLTDAVCAIPCWNDITPGETRWSDAITLIEDDSRFSNLEFQDAEDGDSRLATWQEEDNQPCCQMITQDGAVVDRIILFIAPSIQLSELLDKRGDPTYVVGTEFSDDQAVMNLFYPDTGMIVFTFVAGPDQGELSDSSEVIGVLYTTPTIIGDVVENSSLYNWAGYESYRYYNNEEFDITAVPTVAAEDSETDD